MIDIIPYFILGLPTGRFRFGFPSRILLTPLSFPNRATCPAHRSLSHKDNLAHCYVA
ncbi:hypothetical protein C0J52_14518 [Blattella germanica]|nr:hypothetical protein C0J52_14518 [Blattella germanica]